VIARTSPENRLPTSRLHRRPGLSGGVGIKPSLAGWRYLAFSTRRLRGGTGITIGPGPVETVVVVLSGRDVDVRGLGTLPGRTSPFADLPSAVYVPAGRQRLRIRAREDTELAIAFAPLSGRHGVAMDPVLITPDDIAVEIRGAGNASRQINHIVAPSFPADRLEVVEVYTPSGNWSSWPPHKHDVDAMPGEAVLEEIYHYRFRRPEAWGVQRVYRRPGTPAYEASGPRDAFFEVRDGDVVIVPDGYHPFSAAHGDDAYYLNALAGDRRTMACSFDPDLDWVRGSWEAMEADPRLPLVGSVRAGSAART
jgi:5-deoxy-glucuronate isomerase